jgi:hypothetical protein
MPPMSELQAGDAVVVVDETARLHGLEGTVRRVETQGTSPGAQTIYWVEVPGGMERGYPRDRLHWFLDEQLARVDA